MSHIHDLIDFVVIAYIVYDNKVLLILHKELNMWLPIGGHIELNEDPDEALAREVREECGLEIEILSEKPDAKLNDSKVLRIPNFMAVHNFSETHKHVGLYYYAKAKSDNFKFNAQEHNDIKWFSKEDLDSLEFNLIETVKFCSKEAIKKSQEK